jgi:hypothetical protein
MSTVATARHECFAAHVTLRNPRVPGAAVAHISGASQPFVRRGSRSSVPGDATATMSQRNQSAPASARDWLGLNQTARTMRSLSSRGVRPRCRGSRVVQARLICRCAACESTRRVKPDFVVRSSRPTK